MTSGVVTEDVVEGQRSLSFGEEPLGPGLPGDASAQRVGTEVLGSEPARHALAREQDPSEALRSVLEQYDEDVVWPISVTAPDPKSAVPGGIGKVANCARGLVTSRPTAAR